MIKKTDVTNQVRFDGNDDKLLPITKCVCGAKFEPWTFMIGVYDDEPYACPICGAKLCFSWCVTVYQIEDEGEK